MSGNCAHSFSLISTYDEDRLIVELEVARKRIGGSATCVFVYVSSDWRPHMEDFLEVIQVHGHAPLIVGCSGDGFIGVGEENENVSGCSVIFLHLPNTEVKCHTLTDSHIENATGEDYWQKVTGVANDDLAGWIFLGDPITFDSEHWLRGWNASYPDVPCFGGLASGGRDETGIFLVRESGVSKAGALAVSFRGGVQMSGVISQGCRPIGEPYTITSVDRNVVLGIGMRRAYEVLEETFNTLEDEEKEEAQGNILAGLAMSEYREEFRSGDFLIRNILGGDPDAGALAIGAYPRVGQTMQFQVRDRDTADEELTRLCQNVLKEKGEPIAGMLFTCTGRGNRMFGAPNHDAGVVEETFGRVPLAGFFCNGEIGPVGDKNYIHAYTASLALFFNR
jgi:small ligand-binding sensory domain FIST